MGTSRELPPETLGLFAVPQMLDGHQTFVEEVFHGQIEVGEKSDPMPMRSRLVQPSLPRATELS